MQLYRLPVVDHGRIEVDTSAWQNRPVIETRWVGYQVLLTDQSCLVTTSLQKLWERHLSTVETTVRVVVKAIHVRIFAC
jgi:hypothetical protein